VQENPYTLHEVPSQKAFNSKVTDTHTLQWECIWGYRIIHSKTLINAWGMHNWNPFMHCSGSIDGTAASMTQSTDWQTLV
jgi:hypothetical protein